MIRIIQRLSSLHDDESGAAMTEFVAFLPVWCFLFAGIFALAELNMETTRVQLMAQKQLWDNVIPIQDYSAFSNATKIPNGEAAAKHGEHATADGNQTTSLDVAEAAFKVGAADGHWTESYLKVKPYQALSLAENLDDITMDPTDIVGEQAYPRSVVDDNISSMPSGGSALSIVADIVSASGLTHAAAAGIRYGTVFGEVEDHPITVAGNVNYDASAHYDILVAPAPLTGIETKASFATARLFAEGEDNYSVMMNFGEAEWEGDSSGVDTSGITEQVEDIQQQEDEEENKGYEERDDFCSQEENQNSPECN